MYFEKAFLQPGLLGTVEWLRWEDCASFFVPASGLTLSCLTVCSCPSPISISALLPHYVLSNLNEIWQQSRGISDTLWGHKPEKCLGMWASRKGRNVSVLSLRTWVHQHLSLSQTPENKYLHLSLRCNSRNAGCVALGLSGLSWCSCSADTTSAPSPLALCAH